MKKIILIFLAITSLFAIGKKLNTSISPTENIIIDLDPYECPSDCLENYLNKGMIFSFLAKAKDSSYEQIFQKYAGEINLANTKELPFDILDQNQSDEYFDFEKKGSYVNIALLVPQKVIGKYTLTITKSIFSYLIYKNSDFDFELFNCENEDEDSILNALKEIKEKGYKYVIAPMTDIGAKIIVLNERDLQIYIPTVNKKNISYATSPNIHFGGLDYQKQIDKLSEYANNKIVIFRDNSPVSSKISAYINEKFEDTVFSGVIENANTDYRSLIKRNYYLNDASIFLNTPLVKTSLIASQIRLYKIHPYILLSTQINYHPLLLSLTQYQDRKNMLIANSIDDNNFRLTDINSILNNDIKFDWINYSASIGMDFFYTDFIDSFSDERLFIELLSDNQVDYKVKIVKPNVSGFIDYSDNNESF